MGAKSAVRYLLGIAARQSVVRLVGRLGPNDGVAHATGAETIMSNHTRRGPTSTAKPVRETFLVRTAWRWLLAPVVIVILFGVGDVVRGTAADPAILEGLTGLAPAEVEAQSPEAARFIDFQYRIGGGQLLFVGLALAAITVFGFRSWQPWAWFTMWLLPLWGLAASIAFLVVDRPEGAPFPPPMGSGVVFFAYGACWLAVSYRGFQQQDEGSP
jgi:hypothetical protein